MMQEKKKITVREGDWGDYELLRAAIREEQHIHAVNRPDIFADLEDSPFGREDFEKLMEEENSFFLVAEADGRAAGICNVKLKQAPAHPVVVPRRYAYIDDICILEDFRHMGVGKALYEALADIIRPMGINRVELKVWAFNESAMGFYKALGMNPQNSFARQLCLCFKIRITGPKGRWHTYFMGNCHFPFGLNLFP